MIKSLKEERQSTSQDIKIKTKQHPPMWQMVSVVSGIRQVANRWILRLISLFGRLTRSKKKSAPIASSKCIGVMPIQDCDVAACPPPWIGVHPSQAHCQTLRRSPLDDQQPPDCAQAEENAGILVIDVSRRRASARAPSPARPPTPPSQPAREDGLWAGLQAVSQTVAGLLAGPRAAAPAVQSPPQPAPRRPAAGGDPPEQASPPSLASESAAGARVVVRSAADVDWDAEDLRTDGTVMYLF